MRKLHTRFSMLLGLALLCSVSPAMGDGGAYVSPGIGLSWNIGGGVVVAPKISIGYAWDGRFVNLTVGSASCSADDVYPHFFVECQYGVESRALEVRKTLPLCGGGVGFSVSSTDKGTTLLPRVTAFIGWWIFVNVDVLFADSTRSAIGGELVFPIPLKKIDIGSIGG